MSDDLLHVRAVGRIRLAKLSPEGRVLRGRWVARDAESNPLPDGEMVPRHPYYLVALRDGDLELVVGEAA